jgi:PEP-CTERM motif
VKTYFRKTKLAAALSAFSFFAIVSTSHATVLELDFSNSRAFSGTAPSTPVNPSDIFAKAIFNDGGGSGSVTLTMSVLSNLSTTGAYVKDWYFNAANSPLAGIAFTSGISTSDIDIGTNAFKANGTGGKFDFAFHFSGELLPGHTSVYTLTGAGITANSFNSVSVPAPNGGGYLGAIHVQGYEGTSVWISGQIADPVNPPSQVPEPATLALLGLGFLGIAATRRSK